MSRRSLAVLAGAAAVVASCTASGMLRERATVVRADIEKARKSGALRCAPKELALAETNLAFSEDEASLGHPERAEEHMVVAQRAANEALRYSKTCAPTQVVIKKDKPKIEITKVDRDGDGVPDLDDLCPDLPGLPQLKGCPDSDGDGIPDPEDECPQLPGPPETHGCPVAKDSDGDGIPDDIDRCPLDPEDKDGFQDEDGCPDPDNDGDGIVDRLDACPNDPGPLENQGCPVLERPKVYTLVEVKKEKIEIKQQVHFATAKWRVLPDSFKLLDQVAAVLGDLPKMRVSIEGHTDNVGAEAANMRLSQRRAEAVRDYLVSKGISEARLEAVGYGPTKPIASNKTARGKTANRRTEFKILSNE